MRLLSIITILLSLSACSSVNFQDAGTRLSVQYATAKYIEQGSDTIARAQSIYDEADKAQNLIDLQSVSVTDIKASVLQRIANRGLSIADTMLLTSLVNMIDLELADDINNGIVKADDRIRINALLDIIKQTAGIYL